MRKRVFMFCLVLIISAGMVFAAGQKEKETAAGGAEASEYTRVQVTMEGHAGIEGLAAPAIKNLQNQIEGGELSDAGILERQFKIDYITALDQSCKEKGIEFEGLNWGWSEQLIQKQLNALLAKSGPDVFVGETQMPGFARKGYLAPFPAELEQKVRDLCVKGSYSPMEVDGKIYGVATYPGVNVLFWNKDLLRKAGLDPEAAPKTWDEWLGMCEQITEAGNGEFYGGGTYAGPNFGGSLRVGPFMKMAGGGFIDENGDASFDTPGNVRTMEFLRELAKNSPEGIVGGMGEGGWWDAFAQGKIAYVVDGPWRYGICKAVGIDVGYSELPLPAGGKAANVTIGAAFYSVPAYVENKEAAFKFIESLFDKRVQDPVKKLGYRPPVLKEYAKDSEFMNSYIATFYKTLQGDVSGLPTFKGDQNAKIWDVFHQSMVQCIVTDGDIEQILTKAQQLAEKYQGN